MPEQADELPKEMKAARPKIMSSTDLYKPYRCSHCQTLAGDTLPLDWYTLAYGTEVRHLCSAYCFMKETSRLLSDTAPQKFWEDLFAAHPWWGGEEQ